MDKPANTLKYAYDLHKEYNVPPFFAVEFIDCISCSGQYDNFINLKNAGFTNFFCKKISLDHTNKVGNEKVELICEFKKIGFNDFYAKEAGLRYSLEDLPMLCKIFKVCNFLFKQRLNADVLQTDSIEHTPCFFNQTGGGIS